MPSSLSRARFSGRKTTPPPHATTLGCCARERLELGGLEIAKRVLAVLGEDGGYRLARRLDNTVVQVDAGFVQRLGESVGHGGLPRTHESDEEDVALGGAIAHPGMRSAYALSATTMSPRASDPNLSM